MGQEPEGCPHTKHSGVTAPGNAGKCQPATRGHGQPSERDRGPPVITREPWLGRAGLMGPGHPGGTQMQREAHPPASDTSPDPRSYATQ